MKLLFATVVFIASFSAQAATLDCREAGMKALPVFTAEIYAKSSLTKFEFKGEYEIIDVGADLVRASSDVLGPDWSTYQLENARLTLPTHLTAENVNNLEGAPFGAHQNGLLEIDDIYEAGFGKRVALKCTIY